MPSPLRAASFALLLSTLICGPLAGQTVRGTITERGSGQPISGAVVQLLNADGKSASGVLTDSAGRFNLRASAPGRYRLQVERIGFRSEFSEPLELGRDVVMVHELAIAFNPISLEGITARGRTRGCTIRENGETVSRVWDEARKALNVLALTQSGQLVRFDMEKFRRELDPQMESVLADQRGSAFDLSTNPFRSIPIVELERNGYVRWFPDSTVYYGPDAEVLLSDRFLETHCFELSDGEAGDSSLVGLAFRPARRPTKPDIEGTLWMDRKSSELRRVEYRYVGHGFDVPPEQMAGRIEFEPVPSGAWFVRRWMIRMPVLAMQRSRYSSARSNQPTGRFETIITGIVEEGGEVVRLQTGGGTPALREGSVLSGIVLDSLTGDPLPGAVVQISGTQFSATTDVFGRYELADLPAGRYSVSFDHPALQTLGIAADSRTVDVHPPAPATTNLATPSANALLRRYCPATTEPNAGMLVGYVLDDLTGAPVSGAQVHAAWTAFEVRPGAIERRVGPSGLTATVDPGAFSSADASIEVSTDGNGYFRMCGVPRQVQVELEARAGGASGRRRILMTSGVVAQNVAVGVR